MTLYFRAANGRIEHVAQATNTAVTLCGIGTKAGARYRDSERGTDAKIRPLCRRCRAVLDA